MSRRHTPRDAGTNQTRVMEQTPISMGRGAPADDLGPEAEQWINEQHRKMLDAGTPVSKRFLRNTLLAQWRRELSNENPAAHLTYIRHSGYVSRSVNVDPMGDRIAGRL